MAWCRLREAFRHFKLERLRALEVRPEQFRARPEFSLKEHLEKEIGAEDTIPAPAWFTKEAMERVRRESFTGLVEMRPERGGYEVDFVTSCLDWLAGSRRLALKWRLWSRRGCREEMRSLALAVARRHE